MDISKLNTPGGHLAIFLFMIVLCGVGYLLKVPNAGQGMVTFAALLIHQMNPAEPLPPILAHYVEETTPPK
jgi:hypothetical protein